MQNHSGIPLLHSRTENLAVYSVLIVLALIGLFVVPTLPVKISMLILLGAFGLLHTFGYRNAQTPKQIIGYCAAQTVLVALLVWCTAPSDAFSFLFFVLGVQAMVLLPVRLGVSWIALFYFIDGFFALTKYGKAGLINVLFNLAVYLFTALFGYAIQAAERARRRNQQLLADLQAAQEQVKELAVAEERNRLAREIHDGLGHYLTATTMQVQGARAVLESSNAQVPLAVGALNKAETLLQEALADVRRSIAALRGAPTGNRPMSLTLAALVNQWSEQNNFVVQFEQTGEPQPLPSQVELTLIRTAQEGLTNVRKHAQATQATMTLAYATDKVQLQLQDNGQGCASTTGGYGLIGLRERVQLVGGTVHLHSAPGQGFQLAVEIPMTRQERP